MANEEIESKSETAMEDLFKGIVYSDPSFTRSWNTHYKVLFIDCLDNDQVLKDKPLHILRTLEIIICEIAPISDPDNPNFTDLEKTYFDVFAYISNELTKDDISYNNIDQFIGLIELLSTEHEITTLFKLLSLSHLFFLLMNRNFFELLNDNHIGILFEKLEIKLDKHLYCFYDIKNEWRYTIEDFLSRFNGNFFKKSILVIQKFYEFMVQNPCDPYNKSCAVLNKLVIQNGELPCESIYFNLTNGTPEESETKLLSIIEIFKGMALAEDIDPMSLQDYSKHFIVLFNYEVKYFGEIIFDMLYRHLFEVIFEVFNQTRENESQKVCYFIANNLRQRMSKLKPIKRNEFTLYVISNMKILSDNYFALTRFNFSKTVLEEEKVKYLEIFTEFFDVFCRVLIKTGREERHVHPSISLILTVLKLPLHESILSLISVILKKPNFYNKFDNHRNDAAKIVNTIFDLVYTLMGHQSSLSTEKYKVLCTRVKELFTNFTHEIRLNQSLIDELYKKSLFVRLVCEPTETKIISENFYEMTKPLADCFVSFKSFPKSAADLERLRGVFACAISPAVLDQIQPFFMSYYKQPALYYLEFFQKIAEEINERIEFEAVFAKDVLSLIKILKRKNSFYNLSNESLINYFILIAYTKSLLNKPQTDESLVDAIIDICFFVYTKHTEFKTVFYSMVTLASLNFPKNLAKKAGQLIEHALKCRDETEYAYQLVDIFPYIDLNLFNNYSNNLFDQIIRHTDKLATKNMTFLNTIADHLPEFFLTRQIDNELRLITLEKLVLSLKNVDALNWLLQLINGIIEKYEARNTISHVYLQEIYQSRKKLYKLLFIDPTSSEFNVKLLEGIEGARLIDSMHTVCNLFFFIFKFTSENSKKRSLVAELIDIYKTIKNGNCIYVFNTLKKIASMRDQIGFLKEHYEVLKKIEQLESEEKIQDQVKILCDIIERQGSKSKTEEKLTLDKSNSGEKGKQDPKPIPDILLSQSSMEFQSAKKEQGRFPGAPTWSEELCNQISETNNWTIIAQKLNFSMENIELWRGHEKPAESMLKEWFIGNKNSEATDGLIKVFMELGLNQYVGLIEKYVENVKRVSRKNSYDEEADAPQIFIVSDGAAIEQAKTLKVQLEKFGFEVWIDDNSSAAESSRVSSSKSGRTDRGLRLCKILICLITESALKDQDFLDQVNIAIKYNKPIMPLLIDTSIQWPPKKHSDLYLGNIYLYNRFFQKPNEQSVKSEHFWPDKKFNDLLLDIRKILPEKSVIKSGGDSASQKSDVFISYQSADRKLAIELGEKIKNQGWTYWLDIEHMTDNSMNENISAAIRDSKLVVSILSMKYILSTSCRREVELGKQNSKQIIAVKLDENIKDLVPMKDALTDVKWCELKEMKWNEDKVEELFALVKEHLNSVDSVL